eukprot:m.293983 g.293983  ORF g.293983 m.293983 type:complete len:305 (+) comp55127_c0_seq23:6-920(+)
MFTQVDVMQLCDALIKRSDLDECQRIVHRCGAGIIVTHCNAWLEDTALHLAVLYHRPEILEWFLDQPVDCNALSRAGATALMVAAYAGDIFCTQLLLAHSADLNIKDKAGTALHYAVLYNRIEMLQLFLKEDIDCNVLDKDGRTALMWAAYKGHVACARALIEAGADRAIRTKAGVTALGLARKFNHDEMVALLDVLGNQRRLKAQQNIKPAVRESAQDVPQQKHEAEPSQPLNLLKTEDGQTNALAEINVADVLADEETLEAAESVRVQEQIAQPLELQQPQCTPAPISMNLGLTDLDLVLPE